MLLLSLQIGVLVYILFRLYQRVRPTTPSVVGGPPRVERGLPLVGPALAYFADPVKTLEWAHLMYGNTFRLNLLFMDAVFLLRSSLDGGGSLHSTLDKYFYNSEETGEISHPQGVERLRRLAYFNSNPESTLPVQNLRQMKAAVASTFRNGRMADYAERCAKTAGRVLERDWAPAGGAEGSVELVSSVRALVMELNIRLLLGDAFYSAHGALFGRSFLELERCSADPLARVFPDLSFLLPVRRALTARRTLSGLLQQELTRLRQQQHQTNARQGEEDGHLLSLLAQLKQDDGSWLPTEQLTDTVLQLFYYGHSNTANHLIWLIAHMFQRGHAQDLHRVRREQRRSMGDSRASVSYDQFASFKELEQCIQEVTRLYFTMMLPPRKAMKSFQFEGYTIPAGSLLCVSPILGHLDSDIFPDASIFFPKRFAPTKNKQAPNTKTAFNPSSFYGMAFVQFGYGKHRCPAEKYALTLLMSCFSVLVRSYTVELKENKLPPPLYPIVFGTAAPRSNIFIQVRPYTLPNELLLEEDEKEVVRSILPRPDQTLETNV